MPRYHSGTDLYEKANTFLEKDLSFLMFPLSIVLPFWSRQRQLDLAINPRSWAVEQVKLLESCVPVEINW
jgi:hypothetical protein